MGDTVDEKKVPDNFTADQIRATSDPEQISFLHLNEDMASVFGMLLRESKLLVESVASVLLQRPEKSFFYSKNNGLWQTRFVD